MGKQYGFHINLDRCVQCHACEVACKAHNGVELGIKWRKVIGIWSGRYPDLTNRSISYSCMHCVEPGCVAVCPEEALPSDPRTASWSWIEVNVSAVDRVPTPVPLERLNMVKTARCKNVICVSNDLPEASSRFASRPVRVKPFNSEPSSNCPNWTGANEAQKLAGPTQPSVLISSSKWSTLKSVMAWK